MSVVRAKSKLANEVKAAKRRNESAGSSERVRAARRELAEAKLVEYITRTVAEAPDLDLEARERLSMLLRGQAGPRC